MIWNVPSTTAQKHNLPPQAENADWAEEDEGQSQIDPCQEHHPEVWLSSQTVRLAVQRRGSVLYTCRKTERRPSSGHLLNAKWVPAHSDAVLNRCKKFQTFPYASLRWCRHLQSYTRHSLNVRSKSGKCKIFTPECVMHFSPMPPKMSWAITPKLDRAGT